MPRDETGRRSRAVNERKLYQAFSTTNDVGAYEQVLSFASTSVHTSNCRRNTYPTGLPSPPSLY